MATESTQGSAQNDVILPLTEEIMNNYKAQGKSAFIVGYSGETGKQLTRVLHQSGLFKRIVLIGRRIIDYGDDPLLKNAEQVVVDFENILEREDLFRGIDYGFSCLGGGPGGLEKVDRDYALNTARAAKKAGVKHYALVSTMGVDENSWMFIMRIKHLIEQEMIKVGFEKLTIWRPGALLCYRAKARLYHKALYFMTLPFFNLVPTRFSVPTDTLAVAMLYRAVMLPNEPVDIVDNPHIHQMAANVPALGDAKK